MRILVFSDPHEPFSIDGYIPFIRKIHKKYNCNRIVCCGDLIDQHAVSHHDREPDSLGAETERTLAIKKIKKLTSVFPKVTMTLGNHDLRVYRVAGNKAGVPLQFLKTFAELYELPSTWNVVDEVTIDGVLYKHGEGYSGKMGHLNAAIDARQSTVIGHLHSHAGINYAANKNDLIFGMNVGCLIDVKSYSMRYGKNFRCKPTIGCAVVIDGRPQFIPMDLGSKIIRT